MHDDLYYEHLGDDFEAFMSDYDVQQRLKLLQAAMPKEQTSASCLEVGCGTGRISRWLKPQVGELTVSDISAKLAAEVGEKVGVNHREADACALPFEDQSFDLVVSSECIEHTPDPRQALREMARVLKPGGSVLVTSPNRLWIPSLWLAQALRVRQFNGREIWLFPGEAAEEFEAAGVSITERGGCHLFPWQLPLAKKVLPWVDQHASFLHPLMINYLVAGQKRA